MNEITVKRAIALSPKVIWSHLAELDRVVHFHPIVKSVDMLTSTNSGVGSARRCNFNDGTSVEEKVLESVEERLLVIELSQFSMPFKTARARLTLEPMAGGHVEVGMRMEYEMKFGPLGALMNTMMIRPMMTRMIRDVLEGLEYHARTGKNVNGSVPTDAANAMAAE